MEDHAHGYIGFIKGGGAPGHPVTKSCRFPLLSLRLPNKSTAKSDFSEQFY